MSFKYPIGNGIKRPQLLDINQETEASTPSKIIPKITQEGESEKVRWEMVEIPKGKTYRIDW